MAGTWEMGEGDGGWGRKGREGGEMEGRGLVDGLWLANTWERGKGGEGGMYERDLRLRRRTLDEMACEHELETWTMCLLRMCRM